MSLMLIAGSGLAEFSMPLNKLTPKEIGANLDDSATSTENAQNDEDSGSSIYTGERLENTDTTTYIYDANDLANFRDSVNAGDTYSGKTVYVMRNIDMSSVCSEELGVSWKPIGVEGSFFAGVFEGNYHTINNLYSKSSSYQKLGLFMQSTGIIKNLTLKNVYLYNSNESGHSHTGGISGVNCGEIKNCAIESGSISGYQNASTLVNSDGWRGTIVGGITGQNAGAGSTTESCYNRATISGTANLSIAGSQVRVGGIVGGQYSSSKKVISNCYNTGNIIGNGYDVKCGGIIGVQDTSNIPEKTIVQNCYNIGSITAQSGTYKYIGGIAGQNGTSESFLPCIISNSYCTTETAYSYCELDKTTSTEGRVAPETLKTYAETLGEGYVNDNFNLNGGYPILKWQAPEEINLNIRNEYIKIGEKLQLNNISLNSDGASIEGISNNYFKWTSSNPDVATVDPNGLVTGVGIGHTTITAYNEETGLKAKAIINVYRNVESAVTVPGVASGEGFTAILKEDGTVWTTGRNDVGQLGDGTTTNRNTLQQVKIDQNTYLGNIRKIVIGAGAGEKYSRVIALTLDGEVYAWGSNAEGILGQGTGGTKVYATKMKGEEGVGYLQNIIDIACGDTTTYMLNNEGIVYASGFSQYGQINNSKGNILYPTKVTGINNVIKITAGYSDIGGVTANGETWVKAYNGYGAFGNGSIEDIGGQYLVGTDIDEFELFGNSGVILKEDKTLWTSGRNLEGQLGLGDIENRTVYTEVKYENGENVKAKTISVSSKNLQFIGEDGKIYVAGYNGYGQLSKGDTSDAVLYPTTMRYANGKEVTDCLPLMTGGLCSFTSNPLNTGIIRTDGSIWLSGDNTYGQIGNGTNTNTNYLTAMGTSSEVSLNVRNEYIKTGETLDLEVLGGFEKFNVYVGAGLASARRW